MGKVYQGFDRFDSEDDLLARLYEKRDDLDQDMIYDCIMSKTRGVIARLDAIIAAGGGQIEVMFQKH